MSSLRRLIGKIKKVAPDDKDIAPTSPEDAVLNDIKLDRSIKIKQVLEEEPNPQKQGID
jgi:hypothetical protein